MRTNNALKITCVTVPYTVPSTLTFEFVVYLEALSYVKNFIRLYRNPFRLYLTKATINNFLNGIPKIPY